MEKRMKVCAVEDIWWSCPHHKSMDFMLSQAREMGMEVERRRRTVLWRVKPSVLNCFAP